MFAPEVWSRLIKTNGSLRCFAERFDGNSPSEREFSERRAGPLLNLEFSNGVVFWVRIK